MNFLYKYSKSIEFLFLLFLFGTLSFGRAFSIFGITTSLIPLFITETFLFISVPLIIVNYKNISNKFTKIFLIFITIYFVFGCFYLFLGLINKNLFALRDIVLCGYILFLPIAFIIFSNLKNLKVFLFILFLSNLINLMVGRFLILDVYPSITIYNFISKTKFFNLGLYYGIAVSFLICFYNYLRLKTFRFLALVLLSLNLYMLIVVGVRTLWVATISLIIFLFFVLKKKIMKLFVRFILIFLLVSSILFYLDFIISGSLEMKMASGKAKSLTLFLDIATKTFVAEKLPTAEKLPFEVKARLDNIIWRLKVWRGALKFGLKSFIWGRGFGIYPRYEIWGYHEPQGIGIDSGIIPTHNHLISIFYKMGVVGLSLFLFVNIYVFFFALRHLRISNSEFIKCFLTGSLGVFIFWHTMALFFDVIDSPPTSIFLWIIMGAIFAVIEIDKESKKEKTKWNLKAK